MKKKDYFSKIGLNSSLVTISVGCVFILFGQLASINTLFSQILSDPHLKSGISTHDNSKEESGETNIIKLPDQSHSIFASLWRGDILDMILKTDLQKLITEGTKKEYQPGTLVYQDHNGKNITSDIQVKTRGKMRLSKCEYPPLNIKFRTSSGSLKLVLGCELDDQHQQALLREFIAYRLYNVLTDNSLQVQLVNLHLEDAAGKEKPRLTYALIIEDFEEAVSRIGGTVYQSNLASTKDLNQQNLQQVSIFQYFVGNTDWQASTQHNIKLFASGPKSKIIAVPYDFDHSGLVKAPYAIHNEKMPISGVQDRFYVGECQLDGYEEIALVFLSKKDALINIVKDCAQLTDASRQHVIKYIQRSFEILEDHNTLEEEIKRGCGWHNR